MRERVNERAREGEQEEDGSFLYVDTLSQFDIYLFLYKIQKFLTLGCCV